MTHLFNYSSRTILFWISTTQGNILLLLLLLLQLATR